MVGPMAGHHGGRNAGGYSNNQIKKLKAMEELNNIAEHRVQAFSSWGNPTQPAYTTHSEKANTLMRFRIEPFKQIILRTNQKDDQWVNISYLDGKITDDDLKEH